MKLAFFIGTRQSWYAAIANRLTRLRLRSHISHCELVFEPGDGVDDLMPDGATKPTAAGALWSASSTAIETIPAWSARRAGHRGGVRRKRINFKAAPGDWILVALPWMDDFSKRAAAIWFKNHEGSLYDWQEIIGFLAWPIPHKQDRWTCHEACACALTLYFGDRIDPATLYEIACWIDRQLLPQHQENP
jgi:hypothetical protein